MLMMLAGLGHVAKPSPGDAHDAGPVWARGQQPSPADAHDAGRDLGTWPKPSPADAHDAGRDWAHGQNQVQVMLMMLAGIGHVAKTKSS